VKKDKLGNNYMLRVNYKSEKATSVSQFDSKAGFALQKVFSIDLTDKNIAQNYKIIGEGKAKTIDTLRQNVCLVLAK
jgi:hypothetical protein